MVSKRSDAALLEDWRKGDTLAGQNLFRRYYRSITRFFRNKISSHEDVVDLTQQTFTACVEGRERLQDSASFRSYLFGTACNTLRAYYRKKCRDATVDLDAVTVQDLSPSPSVIFARGREERLLLEALRRISIEQQILVELRYWEGLKTLQIAEILALADNTVRSKLSRAIGRLKEEMAALASSPELLASTVDNLDRWANRCAEYLGQGSAKQPDGEDAAEDTSQPGQPGSPPEDSKSRG